VNDGKVESDCAVADEFQVVTLRSPAAATCNPVINITRDDESEDHSVSSSENPYFFLHTPPPVPDPDIPQCDQTYFHYFSSEMRYVLPYVNIFTSTITDLLGASMVHPALRHGVLSISALLADRKSQVGRARSLEHLQKSLSLIQTSLSAIQVDEGVAISIFLLSYLSAFMGDFVAARKHLLGLRLVFEQLQTDYLKSGRPFKPLTMLIWRMAIRMDLIISMGFTLYPVFPTYVLL
jgi:Fungal specific transcription factor domain